MQDPTTLLSQNWGERQQALAGLEDAGTLWSTYGADQAQYNDLVDELTGTTASPCSTGTPPTATTCRRRSRARSGWRSTRRRSSWTCSARRCINSNGGDDGFLFWNGNLSLPSEWNVQGLWFDTDNAPPPSNMTPGVSVTLTQGPQSIGNTTASVPNMAPQDIAALYNFPLVGQAVATG